MLTKKEILDLLMLLSAIESWGFSSNTLCPDYLHEKIDASVDRLSAVLLDCE
jgi:hypothetical protein